MNVKRSLKWQKEIKYIYSGGNNTAAFKIKEEEKTKIKRIYNMVYIGHNIRLTSVTMTTFYKTKIN